MERTEPLIGRKDLILVTGAAGFIGARVVTNLLERGFTRIRCLTRRAPAPDRQARSVSGGDDDGRLEVFHGNLLSREDCASVVKDVKVV
jgi:uncharacterized protein YbjT (DUF2867 family)